ncbi:MAG: hypothetical protein GXO86_02860 [Chlorobi bacterium]|nr:hypothetical protein [Chlorobiota bacterium]
MKANTKILMKATLIFAFIGFITYLLLILASFLGCCTGITGHTFHQIVTVLVVASVVTFGICFSTIAIKG